jgi:DNA topoisomerase-1
MATFGKLLPGIRRSLARDLREPGLSKKKILAAVVTLLETTYIRVGNESYAEENGSFGLTTLRNRHLEIIGDLLRFRFPGKSAQKHDIELRDAHLARILRKCKDLPGSALFEYLGEDGMPQSIDSGDVNEYLRQISGDDFTAKDFRTWGGTCLAASLLLKKKTAVLTHGIEKRVLVEVVKGVAAKLGNRPATCRKYYIHPSIIDCYASGVLQAVACKFSNSRGKYQFERIILSILASLRSKRRKAA